MSSRSGHFALRDHAVALLTGGGLIVIAVSLLLGFAPKRNRLFPDKQMHQVDPAAWGSDHVGQHVPEYLTGDECLFCHRANIGPGFATNRHNLTIRPIDEVSDAQVALKQDPATKGLADTAIYVLGDSHIVRYLKPSKAYGQVEILSTAWQPARPTRLGRLIDNEKPNWNAKTFGDACTGCHATGVESRTRAYSTVSLDCYVCHGAVDPKHSNDTTLVHLSRARQDSPRVVTSICAQCHIRTGRSKSTELPYANTFVAGDNLFRDFQVDLSTKSIAKLHPVDRHIQENVRDVVTKGREETTCLSCHDVHGQSSVKHQTLARRDLCLNCHDSRGKTTYDVEDVYSATCRY
jgi:predicted CXXCH cytochrome family protein